MGVPSSAQSMGSTSAMPDCDHTYSYGPVVACSPMPTFCCGVYLYYVLWYGGFR